jgi:hypothetical protein
MTKVIDEKELRKAWLKRKFASFEYHEEMLRLHCHWIDVLRKALARAEQDTSPNRPESGYKTIADEARNFRTETMPLIERNDDLGKYRQDEWHRYGATATFRSIPDYSRYLQSEGDMLSWLTPQEDEELTKYWAPMARMAENIRYTVDGNWDAHADDPYWILDEEYTGPIDWPANWRDDVADLAGSASPHLSIEAGQPCPREGWWFTPAKAGSRRFFVVGQVMPAFTTDYGATLWQWDEQQ